MKLVFHGGRCCGMKHIQGMGYKPEDVIYARAAIGFGERLYVPSDEDSWEEDDGDYIVRDHDACGRGHHVDLDFFTDAAPTETYVERLDRLVAFNDTHRPAGVLEITLCTDPSGAAYYDQTPWFPYLEARDFKEVTTSMNSNSGNRIHIFHRVTP